MLSIIPLFEKEGEKKIPPKEDPNKFTKTEKFAAVAFPSLWAAKIIARKYEENK